MEIKTVPIKGRKASRRRADSSLARTTEAAGSSLPGSRVREWDASYQRGDNFLFHPHEEIIRFVSRNIRKRVGFHEFVDVDAGSRTSKLLDLGCGIGRHVIFAHQMGLDAYGVDLSPRAVAEAVGWASREGVPDAENRIVCSDLRKLPWADSTFDYVISHGVLDSMYFAVARDAIAETARVLRSGGLIYCDLISGDDSAHSREFAGEEVVSTRHEEGTVQSYFNFGKIRELAGDLFDIVQAALIQRHDVLAGRKASRYHVVLRKI